MQKDSESNSKNPMQKQTGHIGYRNRLDTSDTEAQTYKKRRDEGLHANKCHCTQVNNIMPHPFFSLLMFSNSNDWTPYNLL